MTVYQVERYYIYMEIKGIDIDKLKCYLDENGLDDFVIDVDENTITIDGIECDNAAAQHEEEINNLK